MTTPVWGFKLLYGCSAFGQMLLIRFVTPYFVHTGFDVIAIGVLMAVRPCASFAGEMCWANIVERGGGFRRTVLPANTIGVVLFACIPLAGSNFLAALALYAGASFTVSWTGLRDARVIATLKRQGADDGEFGRIRLFTALGWGTSGLVGGVLQDHVGTHAMFGTFVLFQCAAMGLYVVLPLEEPPSASGPPPGWKGLIDFVKLGWVGLFLANLFVYGFCASAVETYLFVYLLKDFPTASDTLVGSTLAMMTLLELPVFHFSTRILQLGIPRVMTACHLLFALRCVLYAVLPASHPWWVLWIEPLHGLTIATMWVTAVDFGRRYAPEGLGARFQALVSGLYFQLAFGAGAICWGPFMKSAGYRTGYCVCVGVVLTWCLIFNIVRSKVGNPGDSSNLSEGLLKS